MTSKQEQQGLSEFIIGAHNSLKALKEFQEVQTDLNVAVGEGFSNIRELFIKYGQYIDALDKRLKRIELLLASHEGAGHA